MGIQRVTRGYRGLQGVSKDYKGLQGFKRGYKGLQGVIGRDKALQWTNPFAKMPILWVFETDVFVVQKGFLLYKTSKIVFSRSMTWEYRDLQGVTGGYKGLQGVTGGYKGLQGITRGDKALQGVQTIIEHFFLTRTFPDTFSWSILHKNQS